MIFKEAKIYNFNLSNYLHCEQIRKTDFLLFIKAEKQSMRKQLRQKKVKL